MLEKKKDFRKKIRLLRKSLSESERRKLSLKIIERLKRLPEFKRAKTVMLYYPADGEVDLKPLIEELLSSGDKILLLPKTGEGGELYAVEVKSFDILKPGNFGILEPIGGRIFKPEKIDLVVVPAVAFDKSCNRLGMGKGFYDRFLPRVKGKRIGVGFDFQLLEELPVEGHDVPVDMVITPSKICKKGG
jgi:5-formyltetrahydrofolate cyclo-ligase